MIIRHISTRDTTQVTRSLRLIDHRLASVKPSHPVYGDLIGLLAGIVIEVKNVAPTILQDVKRFLFSLEGVQRCCKASLPESARAGQSATFTVIGQY